MKSKKAPLFTVFLLFLSLLACNNNDSKDDPPAACNTCDCIASPAICSSFANPEPCDDTYTCTSCSTGSVYSDPLFEFKYEWHLNGEDTSESEIDINIDSWSGDIKGDKILVAVVDDSLDYTHPDLRDNVILPLNYNYLTGDSNIDIFNTLDGENSDHGTSVAGLIAARDLNNIGIRGVAPCAGLAGFNLLQSSTLEDEYDAMIRYRDVVSVSNNSWGPFDDGQLSPSDTLWKQAIDEGITIGRNGRGIVYVWAAGNGGLDGDNSNYDGYANYYGVIAVGSVDRFGEKSDYSEEGANLWVCTPADGVTTTASIGSPGTDYYTFGFAGTSAAAPIASGVVALMLRANPGLSWRDVKIILADTAARPGSGWVQNGAGKYINYAHGFGVVNASLAVAKAKKWPNVGPLKTYTSAANVNPPNTISAAGISSGIDIISSNISYIEYVAITVNITHPESGDLGITLTRSSPSGASSILAEQHECNDCEYFINSASFTFGSARHLGESANGAWTLTVKDTVTGNAGTFNSWSIKFYGH